MLTVTVTDCFWPKPSVTEIVQTPAAPPVVTVNVALAAGAVAGLTVATVAPFGEQLAGSARALNCPAYCGSLTVNVPVWFAPVKLGNAAGATESDPAGVALGDGSGAGALGGAGAPAPPPPPHAPSAQRRTSAESDACGRDITVQQ